MIQFNQATSADYLPLKSLWKVVFDEKEPFLELFFNERIFFEHIFVARQGDTILAALHALPSFYHYQGESYPCSYIVGAATVEEYRGQGIMGGLLEKTIGSYTHPVVLFPAVRPYYVKRGFFTTSNLLNFPLTHPIEGQAASIPFDNFHLHRIYLEATKERGALERDELAWQFLLMGYAAVATEKSYALLLGDKAVEAMAINEEGAKELLILLYQRGVKTIQVLKNSPFLPLLLESEATYIPMWMSSSDTMDGVYIAEQY